MRLKSAVNTESTFGWCGISKPSCGTLVGTVVVVICAATVPVAVSFSVAVVVTNAVRYKVLVTTNVKFWTSGEGAKNSS